MIEEVVKTLEFISKTHNRLYQFVLSAVVLKCQMTIKGLSRELASQLQFKIIPDHSAVFCVNRDRNCLIDQNGQKITGDRTKQVFVSQEGTCVFPNKFNNGLQYPNGQPVDFDSLVGQKFYPMTIKVNVPHQLHPATAVRQQISAYISRTVFNDNLRYQSSQDKSKPESEQRLSPTQ
ncbi:MAG: hypothetical protein PVI75_00995 [Gammaproteobacteria bacterium]